MTTNDFLLIILSVFVGFFAEYLGKKLNERFFPKRANFLKKTDEKLLDIRRLIALARQYDDRDAAEKLKREYSNVYADSFFKRPPLAIFPFIIIIALSACLNFYFEGKGLAIPPLFAILSGLIIYFAGRLIFKKIVG